MAGSYAFRPVRLDFFPRESFFAAPNRSRYLTPPGAPVISKDALLKAAWPGLAVEESI
jgi:hypothetical protein